MIVALRAGGDPAAWLEDTRALMTALEVLDAQDREAKRRG